MMLMLYALFGMGCKVQLWLYFGGSAAVTGAICAIACHDWGQYK